jgi:hypothetical protein
MRKKVWFVLTLAVLGLGGLSAASAGYNSGTVGVIVNGDYYFQLWCQGYHDPQNYYRMNGVLGGAKTTAPYKFQWIAAECANGGRTAGRGLNVDSPNPAVGFCSSGWYVNGMAAYYTTTAGLGAIAFSCNNSQGQEYYLGQLGADYSGSYNSARCSNNDVAWGFFGGQKGSDPNNSAIRNLGLICGPS